MPGSLTCALSSWPLLSCWLYDHGWLLGLIVPLMPMAIIAAVWIAEARSQR